MFLNYLEGSNKEGFLKVCVHAALSNGILAEEEKEALAAYCREMDIDVHVPEMPETFDELVNQLSASTTAIEKNIIVLETLALVKSDSVYDEKEQLFMDTLANKLGVSEKHLAKLAELLDKYIEMGKDIYAAITEQGA